MNEEDEALEQAYDAYVLDDIPLIHLRGRHAVADRPRPRRISPFWLIPISAIFFLLGVLVGARFV